MRIPPYYRRPGWQRFFAGVVIGSVISWCFFLFTYVTLQEKQISQIQEQKDTIADLKQKKKIYEEDFLEYNKENLKKLTVQNIEVRITNGDKYKFTPFMTGMVKEQVKDDISDILAKDIDSVHKTRNLIKLAIENKIYPIDDKEYKVKVVEMTISTTVSIGLELSFAK
ncbi:sporulation membrane protein YtrI [Metabacillus arenae]|nr:sporulation membrane protein YtrI [Metabacillus arenae]